MSSTEVSAAENLARPSARRRAAIMIALFALAGEAGAAPAAAPGKTYFFATREACAASGAFSPRECAAAFANARLQLRDIAPRFASAAECRLKFRLCEIIRPEPQGEDAMAYAPADDAASYTPMALGVEMVASARGAEAAPTLAIDTRARLFPYFPVSHAYQPRRDDPAQLGAVEENPSILSADRFEPFSKRKPVGSVTTFTASALGAIEGATHDSAPAETPEQRRARLKAAPFFE
ncbi:DUF1190 domain-containing protein [Methylocystis sp. JAN1]|uniref:DUF1190 domain-containing protein n=1 Tax=Methylocystis sp. JAN1 TaxID=3397211 RepID=UPI003FA1DA82